MGLEETNVETTVATTQYTIDDCYAKLDSIDTTFSYILAIIIFLITVKLLWTVIAKWLFGGV